MGEHYDALETRDPEVRERDLLARLPKQIAHAKANAPGFARILNRLAKVGYQQSIHAGKRVSTIRVLNTAILAFLHMEPQEVNEVLKRVENSTLNSG